MRNGIKLIAFASTRDILGFAETELPLASPCTAEELLGEVCRRYPALAPYQRSVRLAINGAYAQRDEPVRCGDEVALIPPVAGG